MAAASTDHDRSVRQVTAVMAVGLIVLTVVAFWPALHNGFVNWDDPENLLRNNDFRGLGWAQVVSAATTVRQGAYQPLGWLLLSAEYALWGLSPRGYHLVSLVLHLGTVLSLYGLTLALLRRCRVRLRSRAWPAWTGVAVAWYAVHPQRVEAVAWVSAQPYLACGVFSVLAVWAYLRAHPLSGNQRRGWLVGALMFYTAALLFKAPAVAVPAVLVILDVYPLGRFGPRSGRTALAGALAVLGEKLWFVGLAGAFSILAFAAKATTFKGLAPFWHGFGIRPALVSYAIGFSLLKTVVPIPVAVYYVVPGRMAWTNPMLAGAFVLVVGVTALAYLRRRRNPGLVAAWAAFVVTLAPMAGIVSISTQLVTDRYTYLPAMAWVPALAAGLVWLAASDSTIVRAGSLVAALGALTALTMSTREVSRSWRDSESLWRQALSHESSRSMMAYNNLAAVYFDRGDVDAGLTLCRTALARPWQPADLPGRLLLYDNLERHLEDLGRSAEAIQQLDQLSRLVPLSAEGHYRWGRLLLTEGQFDGAVGQFTEALRLDPDFPRARAGLDAARARR